MLVFDGFGSKRKYWNGKCAGCNRFNTSEAWCQTCDPQKLIQGWTSGIKDVDDCIKGFQLKTTNYEDVIEWIPFNRLNNIQGIGDKFLATWLDGRRYIKDKSSSKCKQSRTSSCVVVLKTLTRSQNLLDTLKEVRLYIFHIYIFI